MTYNFTKFERFINSVYICVYIYTVYIYIVYIHMNLSDILLKFYLFLCSSYCRKRCKLKHVYNNDYVLLNVILYMWIWLLLLLLLILLALFIYLFYNTYRYIHTYITYMYNTYTIRIHNELHWFYLNYNYAINICVYLHQLIL